MIDHFARDVSAAQVARREILDGAPRAIAGDAERWAIYQCKERVLRRRASRAPALDVQPRGSASQPSE